jgi:hypothetical protein
MRTALLGERRVRGVSGSSGGCVRGFGCDHLRATVDWLAAVSWLAEWVLA